MKKILMLVAVMALTFGCDDGDIAFNDFNLGDGQASNCPETNIYYRVSDNEAFILQLNPSFLINEPTPIGEPRVATLGSDNTLTYRQYNGTITGGSFFCNDVPPTTPTIVDEYSGTGNVRIVTTANITDGKLTGYTHTITFGDITYTNGSSTIVTSGGTFGTVTVSSPLNFNFTFTENTPPVLKCPENDLLYRISGTEAIIFDVDPLLFENVEGTATLDLSLTDDASDMIIEKFSGTATQGNICDIVKPITPVVQRRYRATSGSLVVTTTYNATENQYEHAIRLDDVVVTRTDTNESVNLNDLLTTEQRSAANADGGFLLGVYVTL